MVINRPHTTKRHADFESLAEKNGSMTVIILELALENGRWPGGSDEEGLVSWCTSYNPSCMPRHHIETMLARWEADDRSYRIFLPQQLRGSKRAMNQSSKLTSSTYSTNSTSRDSSGPGNFFKCASLLFRGTPAEISYHNTPLNYRKKSACLWHQDRTTVLVTRLLVHERATVAALLARHRIFGTPIGSPKRLPLPKRKPLPRTAVNSTTQIGSKKPYQSITGGGDRSLPVVMVLRLRYFQCRCAGLWLPN